MITFDLNSVLEKIVTGSIITGLGFVINYARNLVAAVGNLSNNVIVLAQKFEDVADRQNKIDEKLTMKHDDLQERFHTLEKRFSIFEARRGHHHESL